MNSSQERCPMPSQIHIAYLCWHVKETWPQTGKFSKVLCQAILWILTKMAPVGRENKSIILSHRVPFAVVKSIGFCWSIYIYTRILCMLRFLEIINNDFSIIRANTSCQIGLKIEIINDVVSILRANTSCKIGLKIEIINNVFFSIIRENTSCQIGLKIARIFLLL